VLTRVNFLLAFGLLVLIVFYFGFGFLLIAPLSRTAPQWATAAAGAAVLLSVGLTVQILSMVMSGMAGVASYPSGPNGVAVASQAAIVCGHGALGYGAALWLSGGAPIGVAGLALAGSLYAAGIAIGIVEWRRRKVPAP